MNSKEEVIKNVLEGKVRLDDLNDEEKRLFEDQSEITGIEQILRTSENWETPVNQDIDSNWNRLLSRIEEEEKPVRTLYWLPVAAAISGLLLVAYFLLSPAETITIDAALGESMEVQLPDHSTVFLNAGSSISYSEDWDRKIELKGKARFSVTTGNDFAVYTGSYTTVVLGTEFDVEYRGDRFSVSCYEGEVSVSDGTSTAALLAGERAVVEAGQLVEVDFNPDAGKWTSGEFYFDNVSFVEVTEELGRQFDIEIQGLASDTRPYTGYFFKDNLEEALKLVFEPMGYQYELNGQTLTIK